MAPPSAQHSVEFITAQVVATETLLPVTTLEDVATHYRKALQILGTLSVGNTSGPEAIDELYTSLAGVSPRLSNTTLATGLAAHFLEQYRHDLTTSNPATTPDVPATVSLPTPPTTSTATHPRGKVAPRIIFFQTTGFTLYNDVNEQMIQDITATPLPIMTPRIFERHVGWEQTVFDLHEVNPAGSQLLFTVRHLLSLLPQADGAFFARYGVTLDQYRQAEEFAHRAGFADVDFTWHFVPVIANAIADFLVDQQVITQEQKNDFTLKDWADMIGSKWFRRLMHNFAITTNGTYGTIGQTTQDYHRDALAVRLQTAGVIHDIHTPLFVHKEKIEEGAIHQAITLHPGLTQALRKRLESRGDAIGCPVARYTTAVPREALQNDPHLQSLLQAGVLRIVAERSNDTTVRVIQDQSAIDVTTTLIAAQLREYDSSHGTPYLTIRKILKNLPGIPSLEHSNRPAVNALQRPLEPGDNEEHGR